MIRDIIKLNEALDKLSDYYVNSESWLQTDADILVALGHGRVEWKEIPYQYAHYERAGKVFMERRPVVYWPKDSLFWWPDEEFDTNVGFARDADRALDLFKEVFPDTRLDLSYDDGRMHDGWLCSIESDYELTYDDYDDGIAGAIFESAALAVIGEMLCHAIRLEKMRRATGNVVYLEKASHG